MRQIATIAHSLFSNGHITSKVHMTLFKEYNYITMFCYPTQIRRVQITRKRRRISQGICTRLTPPDRANDEKAW